MRDFLWKGSDQSRGGAKVAWKDVACPLMEGGLGVKRISDWNFAVLAKYLWKVLQPVPTSSWAKWARANLIRGRSIWDIPIPSDCSWTWQKIIVLREKFRAYSKCSMGNGKNIHLWFDNWLSIGPIAQLMGDQPIYETGLAMLPQSLIYFEMASGNGSGQRPRICVLLNKLYLLRITLDVTNQMG